MSINPEWLCALGRIGFFKRYDPLRAVCIFSVLGGGEIEIPEKLARYWKLV